MFTNAILGSCGAFLRSRIRFTPETPISGYSELILGRLHADDPIRTDVEEICKVGDRAAALTKQVLAFSRKLVLHARVIHQSWKLKISDFRQPGDARPYLAHGI